MQQEQESNTTAGETVTTPDAPTEGLAETKTMTYCPNCSDPDNLHLEGKCLVMGCGCEIEIEQEEE